MHNFYLPDGEVCSWITTPFSPLMKNLPAETISAKAKVAVPLDAAFRARLRASHSMFPVTTQSDALHCAIIELAWILYVRSGQRSAKRRLSASTASRERRLP